MYYRQRVQITAICLVFLSRSTSNLTRKFSKVYVICEAKHQCSAGVIQLLPVLREQMIRSWTSLPLPLVLNASRSSFTVGTVCVCVCVSISFCICVCPLAVSVVLHEISSHRLHTHKPSDTHLKTACSRGEAACFVLSRLSFCQ